jgi:hypothetical protein
VDEAIASLDEAIEADPAKPYRFTLRRDRQPTLALAESYPGRGMEPTSGIEPLTC